MIPKSSYFLVKSVGVLYHKRIRCRLQICICIHSVTSGDNPEYNPSSIQHTHWRNIIHISSLIFEYSHDFSFVLINIFDFFFNHQSLALFITMVPNQNHHQHYHNTLPIHMLTGKTPVKFVTDYLTLMFSYSLSLTNT